MLLQLEGDGPLSQRLYRGLCTAIRTGRLAPRTRLPSTRVLARQLRVSRNIVMLAFEQLRAEGYVESAVGSGTFVAASLPDDALAAWRRAPAVSPASTPGGHVSAYARALVERRPFPPAGSAHADRTLRYNFR
ncbi:MAG TPA: winged helix-turn-helix domain-containing protein, partial [Kofleriaceae bacterium]|nr:winged helix-turn-helix domain-containing protein [Kofleriaceae bacterium]